ncbi:MAG: ABC transporter ATP-binding protein [Thermoplasmata archaeon]|nr:ABC transporter ATP-binding protein [Thermoplasmata archaeon]
MENEYILKIQNLKKYFETPYGTVRAVDNISLKVRKGTTMGLVGESGSGKSTTGHVVVGLFPPTSGKIFFKNKDISVPLEKRSKELKKDIQMVFQDPASSLNPKKIIRDIVGLPLKVHKMVQTKEELEEKVAKLLEMVELPPEDFMYRRPVDIGGGEKQAVSIARAIATNPSFVIFDEPTSALDVSIQAKIINSILNIQRKFRLTSLFITHDLSLMRNISSEVTIMYLGKVCEIAPTDVFFQKPLHPYTQMLLSSVPVLTKEEEELKPKGIKSIGEIGSPIHPPSGCRFHPRCPYAKEICKKKEPRLIEVEPGHFVACHLYAEK